MSNFISTFQERFGDWLTALGQHLQLSLLTLIIAIFLSIPLAIYLSTRERASNWVLQLAGVFQTIPSMALLGLFIPIMGIGTLPALTALVIYVLIVEVVERILPFVNAIAPVFVKRAELVGFVEPCDSDTLFCAAISRNSASVRSTRRWP